MDEIFQAKSRDCAKEFKRIWWPAFLNKMSACARQPLKEECSQILFLCHEWDGLVNWAIVIFAVQLFYWMINLLKQDPRFDCYVCPIFPAVLPAYYQVAASWKSSLATGLNGFRNVRCRGRNDKTPDLPQLQEGVEISHWFSYLPDNLFWKMLAFCPQRSDDQLLVRQVQENGYYEPYQSLLWCWCW